ncbi:ATP-binding cassette domain-containing protein [Staphylococcus epidermidis]|mgnify:FL=1|jgi:molybdenum ABC transporter, ATP-binding protein modC|uniref:ATP-binding cassette domain-containing protein n=1 Tax=Staphylococcus epidermidis TaxID=1282 RepID=UPI0002432A0D|nr:ATP-binding cassette domain-containing protein [Staphylococcus epidermidis]EHM68432.1 ABC transporter, ATP-binding protein [Staphylococcus epidermidis VCU071]KAB2192498.1 ATP-binding cassette domain-containing protein [Staphylococcus epidermidis]MBC3169467.1 ATP-binding cassette domain-containing protein [Staphylococcus epidermidis]MBE0332830.1 ATP-binding cassette domain-containing protein [Staphylococcus epidermidis]MBM0767404.1 ATP-binding cassette domain-containing protein [Staphylococc
MLTIKVNGVLNQTKININIEDQHPKIYAIQGPSGIGKTTILNIIAGLKAINYSYIKVGKRVLTDSRHHLSVKVQQRRIGYLFQDYQLFPNMNVYNNITFMTKPSEHINELIHTLKIEHLLEKYPVTLSGGEAQRVALARALSTKPDLILLDEPFSSLDDKTKKEGIKLILKIFEAWQIPIIFVTHSNYEAQQMAHKIITIEDCIQI